MHKVGVFCGSYAGDNPKYVTAASAMGAALARRGFGLVYGGGKTGLMGAVADAVRAGNGVTIGVMPRQLVEREVAHHGLTEQHIVETMHERKAKMADLAEGFITMPGGFGTLDEFCEIITWSQLGFHSKPVAMLNVDGYYDQMLAFFDYSVREGFINTEHRASLIVSDDPDTLLDKMQDYKANFRPKWTPDPKLR